MTAIFQKIIAIVTLPFIIIGGLLFPAEPEPIEWDLPVLQKEQQDAREQSLIRIQAEINAVRSQLEILKREQPGLFKAGASLDIPTPVALFETTLASSISTSATTMTLTSATDKDGNTLASSTYRSEERRVGKEG